MYDGDHPKRFFVRRVSDQVIERPCETHWAAGQIVPSVSLMWERNKTFEGLVNIRDYTVGSVDIIGGDVFPNLIKISFGLRVEIVAGHEPGVALRALLF